MLNGHRRRRFAARAILATSTILVGLEVSPVLAQLAPPAPVRQSVDSYGVDLFSGALTVQGPALSIGPSEPKGMSYYKLYRSSGGWTDNLIAVMNITSSTVTVTFGGVSDSFTQSGSSYIATEGRGATLTLSGSTYTYTAGDGTVAHFDKSRSGFSPQYANAGRVTDITSPSGEQLTYSYDSVRYCSGTKPGSAGTICTLYTTAYRLASVDNRYGYRAAFAYPEVDGDPTDPDAGPYDVATWSSPSGITLSNRASGGSVSGTGYSNAAGQSASYGYSSNGMTSITRPGSSSPNVTIAYSGARVSSLTTAAGTITYASSDSGSERTVTVSDPASQPTVYVFDIASQRLKRVTDATSRTTSYSYDTSGRQTRVTSPEGNYVQTSYDGRGNVIETRAVAKPASGVADVVTSASYPASCGSISTCNKPTSTTDARGNVTDYTYDPTHGGVLTVTAPAPTSGAARPQMRYGYTAITDSVTGASVYQLTSVSSCRTSASCVGTADERRTTISYESGNLLPTSSTTAAGDGSVSATTSVGYDAIGNVTSVDGPLPGSGDTTTTTYDVLRRPLVVAGPDPDGGGPLRSSATRKFYDGQGRLVTQEAGSSDASGNGFSVAQTLTTDYDGADRPVRTTLSAGGTNYALTQYSYDAAGRIECTAQRMNPGAYSSLPSACSLGSAGSFGNDRITRVTYDTAGRTLTSTSGYGTAEASTEQQSYTTNGQVATATDSENNRTALSYDGLDRLVQVNFPVTSQGVQAANGGDYEQYTLDAAGNVTAQRARDGQVLNYGYDALGRMTARTGPTSAYWETNKSYAYDLAGNLTQASDSNGRVLGFAYDALGRRTSQSDNWYGMGSASFLYDAAGRRTRLTWGDGNWVGYDYLANGAMSAIRDSAGNALVAFGYDDLGRRTSLSRANGTTTSYGYDPASRLSALTQDLAGSAQDQSVTFGYNPAGQITSRSGSNDSYAFTGHYNVDRGYGVNGLNQLTSAGGTALGYDVRGNLTSSGSTGFAYTTENYMAVGGGNGLAYDPLGRLFNGVLDPGANTTLTYDGADVLAEIDANGGGGTWRRYVYGPGTDEPLIWYEGAGFSDRRWLHVDERGSVVAVTNDAGNAVAINRYDEYGIPQAGNIGRFQYTGQKWLPTVGLYDYKARMYSPTLGRFMQTDPIGYGDGMNWYNYVSGDPVNSVDPLGLASYYCDAAGKCTDSHGKAVDPKTPFKPGDTVTTDRGTITKESDSSYQIVRDLVVLGNHVSDAANEAGRAVYDALKEAAYSLMYTAEVLRDPFDHPTFQDVSGRRTKVPNIKLNRTADQFASKLDSLGYSRSQLSNGAVGFSKSGSPFTYFLRKSNSAGVAMDAYVNGQQSFKYSFNP